MINCSSEGWTASGSYASNSSTPTLPNRSAACGKAIHPRHHPQNQAPPKTAGVDPRYQASPNTMIHLHRATAGQAPPTKPPRATTPPIRKPERPLTTHPEDPDPEAAQPTNNQPAAATTGPHQPRPAFVDDRQLRRSQRSQAGSPSTSTEANPPNHGRPDDTPLAAQLRDGRLIGPKPPPKEDPDQQPDKDDPSFMQQSLFSAPLTQQSHLNLTTDFVLSNTSQQPQEASPNMPAATAADEPSQTPMASPHQYPPTTPGDVSMPLTAADEHQHTAAAPSHLGHQPSTQAEEAERERSWQRVERHLLAIRQLASDRGYSSSNSAGIVFNAEQALVNLLVDTPTAEALDTQGDNHVTSHDSRSITNQAPTQPNPDRRTGLHSRTESK